MSMFLLLKKINYLQLFIIIIFFSLGFLFKHYRPFPYEHISNVALYAQLIVNSTFYQSSVKKEKVPLAEITNLNSLIVTNTNIESMVLPLSTTKYDLSRLFPNMTRKGGICAKNNKVIFLNNNAELLIFDIKSKNIIIKSNLINHIKSISDDEFIINDILCKNTLDLENNSFFASVNYRNGDLYSQHIIEFNLKNNNFLNFKLLWKFKDSKKNNAGRIISSDNNIFFISFTDHTDDPTILSPDEIEAQDLSKLEGKIVKIDLKAKEESIFTMGHRQAQGLFIDRDGKIYSTEHGPKGGDEFNLISEGKNYGWPLSSHGVDYESYDVIYGTYGRHDKFEKPLFAWNPGIGISQLFKVRKFNEFWENDFLISSLKNKTLYRLRLNNLNSVEFVEEIFIGNRIRDMISFENKIYLWTDELMLIEILPVSQLNRINNPDYNNSLLASCLSCHHMGVTNSTHAAPTLLGIFKRKSGSDPNYKYSRALKELNIDWNKKNILEFILNPDDFLPGTFKPKVITHKQQGIKIVNKLEEFTSSK